MNYLHTPPTKIVRQFVNFRFIFPKMAASLFGLSLMVLSFTATISSLHSLEDSIWHSLQIGLVIKEFDFGTLTMVPRILSSFPLTSSNTIPIFHVDLGFLSINTTLVKLIVGWFLFVDVILWFSRSIFKYSFCHRSQKRFYDVTGLLRLKIYIVRNVYWFWVK